MSSRCFHFLHGSTLSSMFDLLYLLETSILNCFEISLFVESNLMSCFGSTFALVILLLSRINHLGD